MEVPFRIVDVFTPRPLAGNQLCVVPEPVGLDEATMQAIAHEIGFSETTFVTSVGNGRYAMRIFTPGKELPFAGHPTLGTAFVLVSEGRVGSPVVQEVVAGDVRVEVDPAARSAWMTQLPPSFGEPVVARDLVARAIGLSAGDLHADLPVQVASTGLPHTIVPIRLVDALFRARRDPAVVAEVIRTTGADALYLFAASEDGFVARMFDAELGIGEDPATGSAAGPLGAYLVLHGVVSAPGTIHVSQGEQVGRPSELHVHVARDGDAWRIRVGGGVHVVGRGTFDLTAS